MNMRTGILTFGSIIASRSRALSEKLTAPQIVNKFSAFHRTGRFITVSTTAHQLPIIRSQTNSFHALTSYFLSSVLILTLPSKPRSSKWYLRLRFPHQNPAGTSLLSHTRHTSMPISFLLLLHNKYFIIYPL